jgi:hypothetical protein
MLLEFLKKNAVVLEMIAVFFIQKLFILNVITKSLINQRLFTLLL